MENKTEHKLGAIHKFTKYFNISLKYHFLYGNECMKYIVSVVKGSLSYKYMLTSIDLY